MTSSDNQKKNFKNTLNLPTTNFPIRSNHKEDDIALLNRWENENLYLKSFTINKGNEKFIFHDGPPYANGHVHIGGAYNKILKDIVCKSQRMLAKHVPVVPGWDCHGLPIEFAVKKENPELQGEDLKKSCREYAQKWIATQKNEFKQLGVLMNWDNPYLTMSFEYEASTLRAFGLLVDRGYIERKNKTVPWCPSCQTVLATAEIEYQDRKDPSIYVLFTLESNIAEKLFPQIQNKLVHLLVWTTTPWTLPLNRAVLLKPNTQYVVLDTGNNYVIVGKSRADAIAKMLDITKNIIAEFNSQELLTLQGNVLHPFVENLRTPILGDDSVLTEDGTACVHSAPGVGPIDYEVGIKNNLEIYSPITMDGCYTSNIQPSQLAGMSVTQAQGWVIQKLLDLNKLLFKSNIKHSYPHCWRCRGGLIFRATKQWFCDLSKNNLKEKACDAISDITMLPQVSHNRFTGTIEGRLEWCLSRQRAWGVPITALICQSCDYTYVNKDFIDEIADHVAQKGIEYWDNVSLTSLQKGSTTCPQCITGCLRKETDILDVWFDSGISHYAVLQNNPDLSYPANMYLEGKDQHRGWFQSSLLTSMIIEQTPCTKTIVTHGFTVDEQGRKMSKSLGNVVAPHEIIERFGTDVLRLWAASLDNAGDAVVSEVLFKNVQEVFRKIRNTCRFLLSNINDFDQVYDAIPVEKMSSIDQFALQELYEVHQEIIDAYQSYNFTRVFHALSNYCTINLSSFYLDIIKDRLYTAQKDGLARRSAQTVCFHIIDDLTKLMAPVLSFTAEQLSDEYQKNKISSIHLQQFANPIHIWQLLSERNRIKNATIPHHYSVELPFNKMNEISLIKNRQYCWNILKEIRSALLKAIEVQREKQIIKHSLEARIILYIDPNADFAASLQIFFMEMNEYNEDAAEFFKEFLIVSQCVIITQQENLEETDLKGFYAQVEHAHGTKCPRCWQWDTIVDADDLCRRCTTIVSPMGN